MNRYATLLLLLPLLLGYYSKPQKNKPRKGKDYALFFAVNNYENGLDPLKMPISDAEKIAAELTDNFGFTCEIVRNPKLTDIQRKLNEYRLSFANGQRDRSGQLFIYFTGHGKVEYDEGYFLPTDTKTDFLSGSAMSYSIYRKMMDNIPCKHLLVAIDACYSGTFDPNYGRKVDPMFGTRQGELGEREKLLIEQDKATTRLFFTSAATDQTTPDRSSFAKKLLEALKSKGGSDGILTSSETYTFLENANPHPRRGEFGADEAGSSFLFIAENALNTEGVSNAQKEAEVWQNAISQNSLYAYQEYLRQYPNGDFTTQARRKVAELEKQEELNAWARAKAQNTPQAYQTFLDKYPLSIYAETARERSTVTTTTTPTRTETRQSFEPEMVNVQGGTFQMGDLMGDNEDNSEKPVHSVTLSSFQMGKYEVTQAQWQAVMGTNPSNFKGDNLPVENVSWDDVQEYLKKLNQKTGKKYRLPTEAEWEYAAREGGKNVRFGNGKNVANPSEINFDGSKDYKKPYSVEGVYREKTTNVGSFSPNSLGLYDMSDNVWEWCSDWYSSYSSSAVSNPTGAATGSYRVNRGGGWNYDPQYCRVANRYNDTPSNRSSYLGFRVVFAFQ